MEEFSTTRLVRHSADEMFALVADVERYPEFVPLCRSLRLQDRSFNGDGDRVITARMTVAYKLLEESFVSRATLRRSAEPAQILVEYIDGPFRKLENRWTFKPVGEDACEVGFYLAYEFKSRTFAMLMGAVFDKAFRKFSTAFEQRADEVYGVPQRGTATA